jgi:hypothetical protein
LIVVCVYACRHHITAVTTIVIVIIIVVAFVATTVTTVAMASWMPRLKFVHVGCWCKDGDQ